jgi:hypothetical protein
MVDGRRPFAVSLLDEHEISYCSHDMTCMYHRPLHLHCHSINEAFRKSCPSKHLALPRHHTLVTETRHTLIALTPESPMLHTSSLPITDRPEKTTQSRYAVSNSTFWPISVAHLRSALRRPSMSLLLLTSVF